MKNRKMKAERVSRIVITHHADEFGESFESALNTEGLKPNQVIKLTIKFLKSIYKRKMVSGPVELEEMRK